MAKNTQRFEYVMIAVAALVATFSWPAKGSGIAFDNPANSFQQASEWVSEALMLPRPSKTHRLPDHGNCFVP